MISSLTRPIALSRCASGRRGASPGAGKPRAFPRRRDGTRARSTQPTLLESDLLIDRPFRLYPIVVELMVH